MRPAIFTIFLQFIVLLSGPANAGICRDRCTNFFGFTDPICVEFCKKTGLTPDPVPPLFPPLNPGEVLENICADNFRVWTTRMSATCKLTAGFSSKKPNLAAAKKILTDENLFQPEEFNGVEVRFCNLPAGDGFAPNEKQIFLTQNARSWSKEKLAVLIAHEMYHIRQYRNLGYKKFACDYVKNLIEGHKTECFNDLERPAYQFECDVAKHLGVSNSCMCTPLQLARCAGYPKDDWQGPVDGLRCKWVCDPSTERKSIVPGTCYSTQQSNSTPRMSQP